MACGFKVLFKDLQHHTSGKDPNNWLLLPIITTFIFGLLIYSRYLRAKLLAEYIQTTYEINFSKIGDMNIGYETYLSEELKDRNSAIFITRVVSWAVQLIIAIIIFFINPS